MLNWNECGDEKNVGDFVEAVKLAADAYTAPQLAVWLTTPQVSLGHWTPLQMLACGRAKELLAAMKGEDGGNYV